MYIADVKQRCGSVSLFRGSGFTNKKRKFCLNKPYYFIQDLAEKLFKKLEGLTEKFEVKLMLLEFVSRLIGEFYVTFLYLQQPRLKRKGRP